MVQVRSAAGLERSEVQERRRLSPGASSSTLVMLSPEIFGAEDGRTMTRRSPYLLSVLKTGASVETSHLYRPVLDTVRLVSSRTVALLWVSLMVTPGRGKTVMG